jgi:hypothetical protein
MAFSISANFRFSSVSEVVLAVCPYNELFHFHRGSLQVGGFQISGQSFNIMNQAVGLIKIPGDQGGNFRRYEFGS